MTQHSGRGRLSSLPAFFASTATLVAVTATVSAQTGSSERGKQLFEKHNCYYCHGTVGQGGRDGARIAATALTGNQFTRYVRKPTGGMPAFTEKILTDAQLTDIYAYLKSLPTAKPPAEIAMLEAMRDRK